MLCSSSSKTEGRVLYSVEAAACPSCQVAAGKRQEREEAINLVKSCREYKLDEWEG